MKVTSCSTPPLTSPPGTSLTLSASSSILTGTLCLRLLDRLLDLMLYPSLYRKMGCGYNQHTGYVLRNLRDAPRSVIPPRMEPGEVPPGVEEELNTLLANFPSGLMASRLLVEFRLFFGKELNMGTCSKLMHRHLFPQTNVKVDSLL